MGGAAEEDAADLGDDADRHAGADGVGIPGSSADIGFAGFFSKDAIIESAFASHDAFGPFAFWCSHRAPRS